jgi:hypothetical protein
VHGHSILLFPDTTFQGYGGSLEKAEADATKLAVEFMLTTRVCEIFRSKKVLNELVSIEKPYSVEAFKALCRLYEGLFRPHWEKSSEVQSQCKVTMFNPVIVINDEIHLLDNEATGPTRCAACRQTTRTALGIIQASVDANNISTACEKVGHMQAQCKVQIQVLLSPRLVAVYTDQQAEGPQA